MALDCCLPFNKCQLQALAACDSINSSKSNCKATTTFQIDLYADGVNTTFTAQDIIDQAVAIGVAFPDASTVVAGDTIHQIEVSMKSIGDNVSYWDGASIVQTVANEAEGYYTENGGETAIMDGGKRSTELFNNIGCPITSAFQQVQVINESAVVASVTILKT